MFSNASFEGYGDAGFLLLLREQSIEECRLIFAKARVPPIKAESRPHLELAASVLFVQISKLIQTEMTVTTLKTIYWSDSLVKSHSYKAKISNAKHYSIGAEGMFQ
ncbi:Gag-Pol polyprotein [Schistosoma japonicum]|nr:Gag-Pol polyprotein [Schistosoma japonicum]